MSEPNNSAWPFSEITEREGLDIDAIFWHRQQCSSSGADSFAAPALYLLRSLLQHLWRRSTAPVAAPAPAPAAAPAAPAPKAPCTCEGCCGSSCGKPHCRGL